MNQTIQEAMEDNNLHITLPLAQGLRERLHHWQELGADNVLLAAIKKGIKSPLTKVPTPNNPHLTKEDANKLNKTLQEYVDQKVIRPLSLQEQQATKYWVPIFLRDKKDNPGKHRLITNLTMLNKCTSTPKHKAESWTSVKAVLQDPHLTWGMTIDLSNYFHHLEMHPKTARWMRIRTPTAAYQITGMPFGWGPPPGGHTNWQHQSEQQLIKQELHTHGGWTTS
jgi:hypothetical protein